MYGVTRMTGMCVSIGVMVCLSLGTIDGVSGVVSGVVSGEAFQEIKFSNLPYDSNDRLIGQWVLFKNSDSSSVCHDDIFSDSTNWLHHRDVEDIFSIAHLTNDDFELLVQNEIVPEGSHPISRDTDCFAVRLLPGTPKELVHYPVPSNKFDIDAYGPDASSEDIFSWFYTFFATETGWMSYLTNPLIIYWVDSKSSTRRRRRVGSLTYGDSNTVWLSTRLGHEFEVEDTVTGEIVFSNRVMFDSYHIVGDLVFPEIPSSPEAEKEIADQIYGTLSEELDRSRRVIRTFTETGFDIGELPKDLFASMLTYYYNSYNNTYVEEWPGMVHINWWETASLLVTPPWALKRYWQSRLLPMVEAWIGGDIPLETSDIYGIRRYQDGARLLTHVDREETHAVSLIINLEQVGMREPWYVEVYDLNNFLHKVPMRPGQVVYYESARCLHGRMAPLKGFSYSNIFSHYRPVGDPAWFKKENPPGTVDQLPNFDSVCDAAAEAAAGGCNGGAAGFTDQYPFLVPEEPRVTHSNDLYQYWIKVGEGE